MPPSDLHSVARNHDLFKARKIRLQALWNFKSQLGPRARLGNAIVNPPTPARRSKILKNLESARRRRVGMWNLVSIRCAHTSQLQALNQNRPSTGSSLPQRT